MIPPLEALRNLYDGKKSLYNFYHWTRAGDNEALPFQPSLQKGLEWPCLDSISKCKDGFQKNVVFIFFAP